MVDPPEDCRQDLHLFAADTRSAVAVVLSHRSVGHQNIHVLGGCYHSMSDLEAESTLEALHLAVGCWRSKAERQCTAQVHGRGAFYPQPIQYPYMVASQIDDVYVQLYIY